MSLAEDIEIGRPSAEIIEPEEISRSEVRDAFDYWTARAKDGHPPRATEIDPVELGKLLPFVMLVDVFSDPLDFRYRLVGEHVISNDSMCQTGQRLSEIESVSAAARQIVHDFSRRVVTERQPLTLRGTLAFAGQAWRGFESITMPFLDGDGEVRTLLVVSRYYGAAD